MHNIAVLLIFPCSSKSSLTFTKFRCLSLFSLVQIFHHNDMVIVAIDTRQFDGRVVIQFISYVRLKFLTLFGPSLKRYLYTIEN